MPFAGTLQTGTPYSIKVTTITGDVTAATVIVIRRDRIAEVDALAAAAGQTASKDDSLQAGVARILVLVQVPNAGSTRIEITNQGAPVFPTETITQDKTYALDARA